MKIIAFLFVLAPQTFGATIIAVSGAAGTWDASTTTTWVGGVVPTAADNVQIGSGTTSITIAAGAVARSLDATGFTGTITMGAPGTLALGDATAGAGNVALKLVTGATFVPNAAAVITFKSTSATLQTIDFGGYTAGILTFNAVGKYAIVSNLTTSGAVNFIAGELHLDGASDNSGLSHSILAFTSASGTRSLFLGTSNITTTGAGGTLGWTYTTGVPTLSAGTSTITIAGNSAFFQCLDGATYSNLVMNGNSSTINNSVALTTLSINCAACATGTKVLSGKTLTVINFTTNGSTGNLSKLLATSAATPFTISKASGTVSVDFMSLKDSTATGGAAFYAGTHSTNVSGNSGWTFTALPASSPVRHRVISQ